jgi:hypothetical protein
LILIKFSYCEKDFDIYLFNHNYDSLLLIITFSIIAHWVQKSEKIRKEKDKNSSKQNY